MERKKTGWVVASVIVTLLFVAILVIMTQFKINEIQVVGNVHYTADEMKELVIGDGFLERNSLYLYLREKVRPDPVIPFVERVDVEYINNHEVSLTVYEKSLAGCVKFMDEYMYFDKDGIVLESSPKHMEDIPCIKGIHFDTMVMYEPLPVEDENFFRSILTMTQLLNKYEIPADSIRFTMQDEIILQCGEIKVLLGSGDNVEEQISELPNILQTVEGRKGTLYMKDYSLEHPDVIFRDSDG